MEREREREQHNKQQKEKHEKLSSNIPQTYSLFSSSSFSSSFIFLFSFLSSLEHAVVLACRSLSKGAVLKRELIEEAAAAARRSGGASSSSSSSSSSSKTRASAAFTPSLEVRQLDVADLDSVRSFVDAWGDRPLHILVNNAGVFNMGSTRRETTPKDGLEAHLATNHLGHFLLTVRLLPCLAEGARSPAAAAAGAARAAAFTVENGNSSSSKKPPLPFPSRVVSVSSALHAFADGGALAADPQLFVRGYSATAAYANSKLAQVMFTAELRRRVSASGEVVEQGGAAGSAAAAASAAAEARRGGASSSAAAASSSSSASSNSPPPPPIVAVAVHPGEVLTDVVRSLPAPIVMLDRMLMSTLLLTPQEGARAAVFAATAPASSASSSAAPSGIGNGSSDEGGDDLLASAWDPAKCYLFPDCRPHAPAPAVLDPVLGRWLWGFSAAKVGL